MSPRRIALSTAGCAAALTAALVAPGTGVAARATPGCFAGRLAGAIIDQQGAAGTLSGRLIIVNTSNRTCHTRGFIGARLVLPNGHRLATTVARRHHPRARRVLIRPGAAGAVDIRWSDVPVGNARSCPTAKWLRVIPPNGRRSFRVFFDSTACEGRLSVGPVTNAATV